MCISLLVHFLCLYCCSLRMCISLNCIVHCVCLFVFHQLFKWKEKRIALEAVPVPQYEPASSSTGLVDCVEALFYISFHFTVYAKNIHMCMFIVLYGSTCIYMLIFRNCVLFVCCCEAVEQQEKMMPIEWSIDYPLAQSFPKYGKAIVAEFSKALHIKFTVLFIFSLLLTSNIVRLSRRPHMGQQAGALVGKRITSRGLCSSTRSGAFCAKPSRLTTGAIQKSVPNASTRYLWLQ